jgi:hypothetical protein
MRRDPVSSSDIESIGYDEGTQTLEIEFKRGSAYQYFAVPREVYEAMMASSSCGKFFYSNIKDNYSSSKVSR